MIFARPDFWPLPACASIAAAMHRGRSSPAEIFAGGYRVDEDTRRSLDVEVDDDVVRTVQTSINGVRDEVGRFFHTTLTADEGPGFLRYAEGGFYAPHRDSLPGTEADFSRTIAVVLFVTRCEGGSLRIYPPADPPVDVAPAAGTLVAFPATWLHEVLPVTAGVRDTIVDWFY
jgi:predicted 2-oxoglutarate/Fe(II)-dependent dioxygenase YbiX